MLTSKPVFVTARPNARMNDGNRDCMPAHYRNRTIDLCAAEREHDQMVEVLIEEGIQPLVLTDCDEEFRERTAEEPDIVFPEDWCRDLYENLHVRSKMGIKCREAEPAAGIPALIRLGVLDASNLRCITDASAEATLESGDLLQFYVDGICHVMVGCSRRSNAAAVPALRALYDGVGCNGKVMLHPVTVSTVSLHLTTGSGKPGPNTALIDPTLVDPRPYYAIRDRFRVNVLEVAESDRGQLNAANCVYSPVTGRVLMDARFPNTIEVVRRAGFEVREIDNEEHGTVAGGVSCRTFRKGSWIH